MSEIPFKIAFIGSHGVGKTTLCFGLAAKLKVRDLSVEVVHEVARRCPLPINEETGLSSQSWILHSQIAAELVAAARYRVVICDRSVLDNYVYLLLAAGPQPSFDQLLSSWIESYDMLVHVPIVDDIRPDGIRASSPSFQRAVEELLVQEVERRGLHVLDLDASDRDGWLERVEEVAIDRLRPAQLPLL